MLYFILAVAEEIYRWIRMHILQGHTLTGVLSSRHLVNETKWLICLLLCNTNALDVVLFHIPTHMIEFVSVDNVHLAEHGKMK